LGAGAEVALKINDLFVVRGGISWIGFDADRKIEDIDYSADLEFLNGSLLVDLHPFRNGFRVTGGAYLGENTVDLDGTPSENVKIGGKTYTPAEVGTLEGELDLNTFAPYFGMGWISGHDKAEGIQFHIDAGVKFGGDPSVELTSAGGILSTDPGLIADIEEEAENIEDDLKLLGFYPVIGLGVSYRF
jgi:hypothetical protein